MKKQEQKFQTKFNHFVKEVLLPRHKFGAFAFELKDTRGKDCLPFSDVKEHQRLALQAVKGDGLVYKISDSGMGQKPFDSFAIKNCPAYVVIKFKSGVVIIPIDTFLLAEQRSKRKSLEWKVARDLSTVQFKK